MTLPFRAPLAALALAALSWAAPALAAVEIEEVTSPGGIEAWLVREPSIPFVALELRLRGGSSLDVAGKRGATNLMVGLLEEGAGDLDAQGFAEAREALAASYAFDVGPDSVSISARFLTENRDEAVDLLRSALVEPTFDPVAVERVRGQVLAGLRSDESDPQEIAGRAFAAAAFGDHPYGSDQAGTEESVRALTRGDVVEAWRRAVTRADVYVGAVGDITGAELGALLDGLLGDLPADGPERPGSAEVALEPGVQVVPWDTPQSVILFGHEGIARDDPDFIPAFILNGVLGGSGRQSRLMEEVREKRGLTYGIGTYLAPRDLGATYQGSVQTANATAGAVVEAVRGEWRRMAEGGVTAEELAEAKTYLTGAYPLRFDGNGTIADILVGMQMSGLGVDYIARRNDLVEAVTLEEVRAVAARILRPDALSFVVVGRPEGLGS